MLFWIIDFKKQNLLRFQGCADMVWMRLLPKVSVGVKSWCLRPSLRPDHLFHSALAAREQFTGTALLVLSCIELLPQWVHAEHGASVQ
jgi:hypothetical protein